MLEGGSEKQSRETDAQSRETPAQSNRSQAPHTRLPTQQEGSLQLL